MNEWMGVTFADSVWLSLRAAVPAQYRQLLLQSDKIPPIGWLAQEMEGGGLLPPVGDVYFLYTHQLKGSASKVKVISHFNHDPVTGALNYTYSAREGHRKPPKRIRVRFNKANRKVRF